MSTDILLTGANGQIGWEVQRARRVVTAAVRALPAPNSTSPIADAVAARVIDAAAPRCDRQRRGLYRRRQGGERRGPGLCRESRWPRAIWRKRARPPNAVLVHVSTDYVFAGDKNGAYVEDDPVAPLGVYGASKLAGEKAVRQAGPRHIILRTAWVYGVHGHNFVKTMLRLGREREVLRVVDDQHGCPTSAGDLAEAVLALAKRLLAAPPSDAFGTFHCVAAGQTTWCGFARAIFAEAGARLAADTARRRHHHRRIPDPGQTPGQFSARLHQASAGSRHRAAALGRRPRRDAERDIDGHHMNDGNGRRN